MSENKKYDLYKAEHPLLKLSDIKKLTPGQKLSLAVFVFPENRIERFTFAFSNIEPAKGASKKFVHSFVNGVSKYLEDFPMSVCLPKKEIRIVISGDISPVHVDKATKPTKVSSKIF